MENKFSLKGIENVMMGGNGGKYGKNVRQQKGTTRQVLGSIWSKSDQNVQNAARIQPERAAKKTKNQKRKPLAAVNPPKTITSYTSHINNALGGNNNIRISKFIREPPSNNITKKAKFSVYCEPTPAPVFDNMMEFEEAWGDYEDISPVVPIRTMNAEDLRELQYQPQLAYIRNFENKDALLKQWQQQPQSSPFLQQHEESKEELLEQQLVQQKVATHSVDLSSYNDMDMDKEDEEEEEEEDAGVGDDDDDNDDVRVAVVKGEVMEDGHLMMMREYRNEIYKNCRKSEIHYQARPDYMRKQFDLTHPMRSILVDWMVEVVDEYHLKRETLFLAVNYVDRFLSLMSVIRDKLQLLGAAAMFVAAKYEEIYPPDVAQFVYISDDTYTVKQILQMEQVLLKTLQFSTAPPTSNFFATELLSHLSVRCVEVNADDEWMQLAMYMLEQSLLDGEEFLGYKASLLASSAVLLSNHMLHDKPCAHKIRQLTGYYPHDMTSCISNLHTCLLKASSHPQQAIHAKYSTDKYQQVAKYPVPQEVSFDAL